MDITEHIRTVVMELEQALRDHKPFNSPHEGYAVMLEELDELWEEVKMRPGKRSEGRMRSEARQVAAMAIRFMLECT